MLAVDIIREVMKMKGVTVSSLSSRLGVKQSTMSQRLTQKNVSVVKLNEMLRVMDYKLVAVPRTSRMPEGSYEVE